MADYCEFLEGGAKGGEPGSPGTSFLLILLILRSYFIHPLSTHVSTNVPADGRPAHL
jgi:hypothetical protein